MAIFELTASASASAVENRRGYAGVTFDKKKQRWKARDGKTRKWLNCPKTGRVSFKTEQGAAFVYLEYLRANPDRKDDAQKYAARLASDGASEYFAASELDDAPRRVSSRFLGVSFNAALRMWEARMTIDGVAYWIGRFRTEERAATAVNAFLDDLGIDAEKRPRNVFDASA